MEVLDIILSWLAFVLHLLLPYSLFAQTASPSLPPSLACLLAFIRVLTFLFEPLLWAQNNHLMMSRHSCSKSKNFSVFSQCPWDEMQIPKWSVFPVSSFSPTGISTPALGNFYSLLKLS